jgi:hypothetical protein
VRHIQDDGIQSASRIPAGWIVGGEAVLRATDGEDLSSYFTMLPRVIRSIWRVNELYPGGPGSAPAGTGANETSMPVESVPRLMLTIDQHRAMTRIKHMARAMISEGEATGEDRDPLELPY